MGSERLAKFRRSGDLLAWVGFALMIGSFVWWQIGFGPPVGGIVSVRKNAAPPFSLVVLDPGHGGQDSGSMCGGVSEKDLTLDIAQRVDRLLQAQGIATLMTRNGDTYVSLNDRAAVTNRAPNCVFVSIHFNEENKRKTAGVETYYAEHQLSNASAVQSWLPFLQRASFETSNPESEGLAGLIQEALVARTQAGDRGTKSANFFVIANVRHPAVLVEGGFLSSKEEMDKLMSEPYREQMAAAISEGILRYREVLQQRQATLATTATGGSE
jgi:N-acetylmuramoyl-L-alanine amidase